MDYDDVTDLLGNKQMPVRQQERSLLPVLYYTLFCTAVLASPFAYYYGRKWIRDWKEDNYRKMVRRKYGIPDSSKEPFNVAYAKAVQKRKEEQLRKVRTTFQVPSRSATNEGVSSGRQEVVGSFLPRQRTAPIPSASSNVFLPEGNQDDSQFRASTLPQNSGFRAIHNEESGQSRASNKTRSTAAVHSVASTSSHRKRALDKDEDCESSKKSRNESRNEPEETIVEAQHASMDVSHDEVSDTSPQRPPRGSKRQAEAVEEIANTGSVGKKAGKRARRQSRKLQEELLDGDRDEDQLMDLDPISRGKKRDRAEAGSTFGGDEDSPLGGRSRKNRRQKHNSTTQADIGAAIEARGTKRNFEVESTLGSDEEDNLNLAGPMTSRKRGKRMDAEAENSASTSTTEASVAASNPSRGSHRIGEEWQVNGELYKLGADGRRLRQVLIRKRRSRFSMPEDSQHPDTQAQFVVLVETWLNDDEFKAAEERGEIFSPKTRPEDAGDVEDFNSPVKSGKQLLWSSPQKTTALPKKAFRNSIVTNVGLNFNPFERPSLNGHNKRVSLGNDSFKLSPLHSPAITPSKSYSKWEKQDLEAEAMAKLRKKLEEEKKVVSPTPKKVSFVISSPGAKASGITTPSNNKDFSAPASLPAFNMSVNTDVASKTTASNCFSLPTFANSNGDTTNTSDRPTDSTLPKSISFAPSQPSPLGNPPINAQLIATSKENKAPSAFQSQPDVRDSSSAVSTAQTPNSFFGDKNTPSNASNGVASTVSANLFGPKPAPVTSTAPTAKSPSDIFSIKGAAQTDKPQTAPSSFSSSFSAPSNNAFPSSSFPSPFSTTAKGVISPKPGETSASGEGLQAKDPAGGGTGVPTSSATSNGTGTGTGISSSPFSFTTPPKQMTDVPGKPAEQTVAGSSTTPKFSFGFTGNSSAPAAALAAPPASAPAPSDPPKSAPAPPPFKFNLTPPSQSSSTQAPMDSTSSVPTFSMQAPAARPSSAAGLTQAGGSAFGGTSGAVPGSFQFGAPTNGMSNSFGLSSKSSPFGGASGAPASFGVTTKVASPSPSPFGAAAPATSVFGGPAKPASDAPKTPFGGANTVAQTSTPSQTQAQPAGEKQPPKFSFNFGASSTPATTSSTTFGAPAQNGSSTGTTPTFSFGMAGGQTAGAANIFGKPAPVSSVFGAPAGGAGNGNGAPSTNMFGSNSGASVFGNPANGSK